MSELRLSATPHLDAIRDIEAELHSRKNEIGERLDEIKEELSALMREKEALALELSDINYTLPKAITFKKYAEKISRKDNAPV